jgi:hypothetical protein
MRRIESLREITAEYARSSRLATGQIKLGATKHRRIYCLGSKMGYASEWVGRVCPQHAASLQSSSNGALGTDAPYQRAANRTRFVARLAVPCVRR